MSSNEVDPNDWDNYILLLQEYRTALDAAFPNVHKELTIAMGMGPQVTGVAPKAALGPLVDAVNMMTYDFNGAWDMLTSHNAPLFNDPAFVAAAGGRPEFNIDWGIGQWLQHIPASKIVMGLPSYGRAWTGATGEYTQGTGAHAGSSPFFEAGLLSYWDIAQNYAHGRAGCTRHWNDVSKVPYISCTNGDFISYDDDQSIGEKVRFAHERNLGGIMWWEVSLSPSRLNARHRRSPTAGVCLDGSDATLVQH